MCSIPTHVGLLHEDHAYYKLPTQATATNCISWPHVLQNHRTFLPKSTASATKFQREWIPSGTPPTSGWLQLDESVLQELFAQWPADHQHRDLQNFIARILSFGTGSQKSSPGKHTGRPVRETWLKLNRGDLIYGKCPGNRETMFFLVFTCLSMSNVSHSWDCVQIPAPCWKLKDRQKKSQGILNHWGWWSNHVNTTLNKAHQIDTIWYYSLHHWFRIAPFHHSLKLFSGRVPNDDQSAHYSLDRFILGTNPSPVTPTRRQPAEPVGHFWLSPHTLSCVALDVWIRIIRI